jgi:hypothetical protein
MELFALIYFVPSLLGQMVPKIIDKYPEIEKELVQFIADAEFMQKCGKSATDNRWSRSMVEWYHIAKDAKETTITQARKKHHGVAPDGKKIYLHSNQIKKKINQMKDFKKQYLQHYIMFDLLGNILSSIISEDKELFAEYEKMSREYDKDQKQHKREKRGS